MKLLISICLLLFAAAAQAEPVCVSYYAAEAFSQQQCTAALAVFNGVQYPCMSVLWGTFGAPKQNGCTERFLSKFKDRPHRLEIHFSNESGRRRNSLYGGELLPRLSSSAYSRRLVLGDKAVIKKVRQRAQSITRFIKSAANANSDILLTTGLEDDFTNRAWRVVFANLKEIVPRARFVRNPNGRKESGLDASGADYFELHSPQASFHSARPVSCIVTNDGQSITFKHGGHDDQFHLSLASTASFIRNYVDSCQIYLWWCQPQGNCAGDNADPRRRTYQIDHAQIVAINRQMRNAGE